MVDQEVKQKELINYFNTVSPYVFLDDLANGSVTDWDLEIVHDVMKLGLNDGVINVLLNYVILMMNGKLSRPYVMKIAGHWARLKITTVEQAMEIAKKERNRYDLWIKNNRKTTDKLHDTNKIDSILGAIKADLNDEQLGKYVRSLFSNRE